MKRYVIEREMPWDWVGRAATIREAAQKSNQVLAQLAPDVQWIEFLRDAG